MLPHVSLDPITIRDARPEDLIDVALLAAKLVRLHHAYNPQRFLRLEPLEPGYERFLAGQLREPDAVVLVAVVDNRVVAYAYARLEPRNWNELLDACGKIHDVYVDESARRRGVARALVNATLARLYDRGAPRVVLLSAWENPEAQAFFESLGFAKTMVELTRERDARDASE